MGDGSNIGWTDATWNPLIGCSRTSPGCDACYAVPTVHRGAAMGTRQHVGLTVRPEGGELDWTGEVRVVEHLMDQPIRWGRPRRVFVNSLSDLFHENVSVETIGRIFATMARSPQHQFQVLTKRSKRMRNLMARGDIQDAMLAALRAGLRQGELAAGFDPTWPLPNVWLGVSIESDRYTFRADHLRDAPAAIRWISAEPLLEPLPTLDLEGIDWIVVGGESGPTARLMAADWAADLMVRSRMAVIETPDGPTCCAYFLKQTGSALAREWGLASRAGSDLEEIRKRAPSLARQEYPRALERADA